MRILIVEDEPPAREQLAAAILAAAPDAVIAGVAAGVAEALAWIERNPQPDLMFFDIQLSDGPSFEILRRAQVSCPVIFATAFDEYLLEAFESNGIDYLLKPFRAARVAAAIDKFRRLRDHFAGDQKGLLDSLAHGPKERRERFLVRKGIDFVSVPVADAAYFFTSGKLVFLVTHQGARHLLDKPLAELEAALDPARFFRASRAWLVSIDSVVRCRPYGKGKLQLELTPPAAEEVIVSQERAAALRAWLGG